MKEYSHRFSPFSFFPAQGATCPANTAWRNRTAAFGWSVIGRTRMDFTPWCTLPGKTSTRPASPAPVKASREFTITKMGRNRNNKITSPFTRPRTDIDRRSPVDRSHIVPLPGYKHLIVSPFPPPPRTKGFRYRLLPPPEIAVKNVLYCKYRICFFNKLQRTRQIFWYTFSSFLLSASLYFLTTYISYPIS